MTKYQVSWIVLNAETGKATSRDLNEINKMFSFARFSKMQDKIVGHFKNKEEAQEALKKIKGLFKSYKATIITDAQFGLGKVDYSNKTVSFPYTTKQLEDSIVVN
ncbi:MULTISPECIES: hypothetical protein [unclassified Empedobacter]|uniref:hypothetical protein n=1 Tax=unclassified Empedobacter TaxID=2643773 RepID=UPI0025BD47F9|nr:MULTISPECIES: hypothetical protein [unclassified Empedobacter]